jgi:DNA (cytosine-5)-methyltransferase 1
LAQEEDGDPVSIGSLFSGIGGLELGLERAGLGPTLWQVEIDAGCRRVLERHWPKATRHEDVRTVGRRNLEPVEIICGGFPCQDVSQAARGRNAGLAGARSGLWFEFARIVWELRPRSVVVENVASGRRRWLPEVRRTLHLLGYDSTAYALSAAEVGAPHARPRIFVVGHAHGGRKPTRALDGEVALLPRDAGGVRGGWLPFAGPIRVDDGLPPRLDRLKMCGNAVVPQQAEVIGRLLRTA